MAIDSTLPKGRSNSQMSWTQRLNARLTPPEVLREVGRMLSAYSTGSDLPDGYIANVATVLSQFPREVAVQCCSPVHGIARECKKFRPNVGEVHEWCEIHTEPIWERAKFERPALPAPVIPRAEMAERKAQCDRVIADLKKRIGVQESWFERLTVEDAMRNLKPSKGNP